MSSAASLRAAVNASPHAAAPPHSGRFGSARTSASAPASPSRERATSLSSSDATTCRTSCAPFSVWPAGRATPATLSWVASTSTSSMLSASLAASSSSRFYSPPLPAASTDVPETAFSPASAPTAHLVPAAGVAARPTRPAPPVPPINTARSGSSPASSAVLAAASSTSPNPQTARVDIFSGTASWCSSLSARERCTAAQVPPPLPTQPTPLFALLPAWGSESDLVSARRWPAAGDDGTGADARRPVDTWHPSSLIGVRAGLPTDIGADAHGSTWKVPCIGCTREEGVQVDAKQLATTRRDEHEVTTHSTTSSTLTRREPHSLLPLKKSDLTANLAGSSRAGQSSRSLLEIQRLAPMPSPPPLPPHPPPRLPLAATPRRTTSWDAVAAAGAPHSSTQPRLGLREAGVERSAVSAEMERSGHSPKRRETEPPRGLRRGNAGSEDTVGDFKCQGNLGTTRRCSSSPARAGECQHGVLRSGGSVLAAADSEARRILERDAAAANAGGARGASTLEGGLFTTAPDATPFTSPPLSARAPRTNAVEGPMVLSSSTGSTDLNRTTAPPPGRLTANLSEPLGDGEVPSTPSTPLPCGDSSANSLLHRSPTATVAVDAGETTARWVSYVGLPASLSQLAVPPQTPSAVRHSPPRRAVSFNVSQSKRPGLPASPPMPPKRPPTAPPLPHVSPRTAAVLSEPQQQFLTRPTWLNSGGSNTGGGRGAQGESPRQRLRVTSALTSQAVVPGSVESPPAESVKGGVPLSPASARVPGSFAIVPVSVSPRQPAPATVLVAPPRGSPIGCPCTLHSPSDGSCADAYTTAHHGGCGARCGDADDDDARFGINCGVVERAYTPGGGDDASAGSLVLSPTVSPQRIPHFPGGLDPPVTTVPPGDRDAAQTSSNYLAPLDSSAPGSPASTPHQTPPQLPPSLAPAPQQPIPPQQQQHHRHQLRMLSPLPRHPRAPSSIAHHLGGGSPPPSTRRRPYGGLAQLRSLLADSDDEPLPPLASDVAGGRPSEHGDEGETEPGSRHSPGGTSAVDGWRTGPAPRRRRRRIGTTEEPAGTSPRGANETSLVTAEAERTRSGHTSPEQCPRSVSSPPLTAAQPLRGPRSLTAVDSPRYSSPPLQFSSRFSDNVGTMADTSPSPPSVVKPSVRAADAPCPPPTHGWATGHSVIPVPRLILPGDTTPTPLGAAADVASGSTSAGSPITPSPPASALAPAELHEASPTVVLEWWVNGPPQPLPPTTAGADESARTSSATIATGAVSCGDDSSGRQGGMALTSHKSDCSCSSTPQLALAHRARPVPPPPRPLPFTPVTLSPPAAPLFSPLPLLPVLPDAAKPLPPSASSPVAPVVVASCAASHEQEQATAIEGWHSPHRRAQASPGSGSEQPDTMSPPPPEETSAQQRSAVPSAATGLQPFFGQAAGQAPRKNETTTRAGRPQQPLRLSPEHSLHQPKHHRLAPRRRPRLPTVVLRPAVVPFSPPPFLRAPACSAAPPPPCRRPRSPPGCTEGRTASPGGRQTRAGTGNEGTHEEKSEGEKEGEQRGECKIADARRPPSEGGRLAEDTKAPRGEREAKEIAESAVWAQRLEKAGHETANREVNSAPGPRHTRTKAAIDEGMIDHDVSATSATLPTAQHVATPARPRETAATSHQPVPSGVPGNADATTLMRSPHRDSGGGSEPLSVGVEAVPSHKLHGTSTTPEGRRPLTAVRCLAHGIPWGNVSARAPSPPARRAVGPPTSAKSQRRAPVPQHQQQQQQPQLQPQKQQQHCQHGIRQQTQPEAPPPPPSPQLTLLPSPSPPPPPLPHSPTETPLFIEGTTSARLAEPPALSTAATITATSSAITTSAAVAVTRSVSAHLTPHPSTSAGSPPSPLPPQLPPPSALPAAPSLLLPIATSTAAFPTAAGADVNAAGSIASSAPAATAAGPLAPLRARAVSDAAISNITVLSSCDLLDGAAALQLGSSLLEYTFGAPATPVLAGTTLEAANNSTAAASPRCTLHNSLTLSSSAQQQGPSLPAPTSAVSPRPQCTCTQAGSPGSISPQGGTSSPGRSAPPGGDMSASWGSLAVLAREGADPWGDARLQVPAVEAAGGHGEGWGAGAIRRSTAWCLSPSLPSDAISSSLPTRPRARCTPAQPQTDRPHPSPPPSSLPSTSRPSDPPSPANTALGQPSAACSARCLSVGPGASSAAVGVLSAIACSEAAAPLSPSATTSSPRLGPLAARQLLRRKACVLPLVAVTSCLSPEFNPHTSTTLRPTASSPAAASPASPARPSSPRLSTTTSSGLFARVVAALMPAPAPRPRGQTIATSVCPRNAGPLAPNASSTAADGSAFAVAHSPSGTVVATGAAGSSAGGQCESLPAMAAPANRPPAAMMFATPQAGGPVTSGNGSPGGHRSTAAALALAAEAATTAAAALAAAAGESELDPPLPRKSAGETSVRASVVETTAFSSVAAAAVATKEAVPAMTAAEPTLMQQHGALSHILPSPVYGAAASDAADVRSPLPLLLSPPASPRVETSPPFSPSRMRFPLSAISPGLLTTMEPNPAATTPAYTRGCARAELTPAQGEAADAAMPLRERTAWRAHLLREASTSSSGDWPVCNSSRTASDSASIGSTAEPEDHQDSKVRGDEGGMLEIGGSNSSGGGGGGRAGEGAHSSCFSIAAVFPRRPNHPHPYPHQSSKPHGDDLPVGNNAYSSLCSRNGRVTEV